MSRTRAPSRCVARVAWLYRSRVIATVAWPSISETSFGYTPWPSSSVAVVCRASWGRTMGTPALEQPTPTVVHGLHGQCSPIRTGEDAALEGDDRGVAAMLPQCIDRERPQLRRLRAVFGSPRSGSALATPSSSRVRLLSRTEVPVTARRRATRSMSLQMGSSPFS